ncbi:MAG TPA: GIY-YIG nuclease family protein [Candidatus Binataceae bacterium]|nr:GIY-YIG nuclease family protein [Candidatus Binataceae bacterium]
MAYYVYIMSSPSRTLYTGVTKDIVRRVHEHQGGASGSFTGRYRIRHLVYLEETAGVREAIAREKQLKGWTRSKKIAVIESSNPAWRDLGEDWAKERDSSLRSE